jgi:hypothetical protein
MVNSKFAKFHCYQQIQTSLITPYYMLYSFYGAFELNSNIFYEIIKLPDAHYPSNILFIIFTVIISKVKSTIIGLETQAST